MEKEEKVIQVLRGEPSESSAQIQSRLMESFFLGLRDILLARMKSGMVTEDMNLSSNFGSLDIVQLTTDILRSCAALGVEPTGPVNSVGDLLRLLETIDSKREYSDKSSSQTP
jgi:hypothetical protein